LHTAAADQSLHSGTSATSGRAWQKTLTVGPLWCMVQVWAGQSPTGPGCPASVLRWARVSESIKIGVALPTGREVANSGYPCFLRACCSLGTHAEFPQSMAALLPSTSGGFAAICFGWLGGGARVRRHRHSRAHLPPSQRPCHLGENCKY